MSNKIYSAGIEYDHATLGEYGATGGAIQNLRYLDVVFRRPDPDAYSSSDQRAAKKYSAHLLGAWSGEHLAIFILQSGQIAVKKRPF